MLHVLKLPLRRQVLTGAAPKESRQGLIERTDPVNLAFPDRIGCKHHPTFAESVFYRGSGDASISRDSGDEYGVEIIDHPLQS